MLELMPRNPMLMLSVLSSDISDRTLDVSNNETLSGRAWFLEPNMSGQPCLQRTKKVILDWIACLEFLLLWSYQV